MCMSWSSSPTMNWTGNIEKQHRLTVRYRSRSAPNTTTNSTRCSTIAFNYLILWKESQLFCRLCKASAFTEWYLLTVYTISKFFIGIYTYGVVLDETNAGNNANIIYTMSKSIYHSIRMQNKLKITKKRVENEIIFSVIRNKRINNVNVGLTYVFVLRAIAIY